MINVKNQCMVTIILSSLFLQAGEMRVAEIAPQSDEQVQASSSWNSKSWTPQFFGNSSDKKVQQDPHGVGAISQDAFTSQVKTIKPSVTLTDSSTTSDISLPSQSLPRVKPVEKKSTLQFVTNFFKPTAKDINAVNKKGMTQLHTAISQGDVDAVELLIRSGANVNLVDNNRNSPLHLAMQNCYKDRNGSEYAYIAQCLLENGALCNVQNKQGQTPLHYASQSLHVQAVNLLIEYKIDVNVQDNNGCTPLIIVIRQDLPEIIGRPTDIHLMQADVVKKLLQAGADAKIMGNDKQPIADYVNYKIKSLKSMLPVIADYIYYAQYPQGPKVSSFTI